MNREIKFRGLKMLDLDVDNDLGEWVFGSLVDNLWSWGGEHPLCPKPVCQIIISGECDGWEEIEEKQLAVYVHPDSIGQWTGLKDKNGLDCYEGDVVNVEFWSGESGQSKGQIIFAAGCFFIQWIDDPEANMEPIGFRAKTGHAWDFTILGNIFENPELLKTN